jgi:peptide/nickel transport system ATP-binding protein
MTEHPMITIEGARKVFDVSSPWLERVLSGQPPQYLVAVDDVSLTIGKGKTFALVGESGSGKSTVARMVTGLLPATQGRFEIDGHNLDTKHGYPRALRRRMQMIFQDPYASLDPRWRVGDIIAEPMRAFDLVPSRHEEQLRVGQLLTMVGLDPADAVKFPHQFSGGQRQRIAIARALASDADVLVCDEPTSALDVSVQAQILNLMKRLQKELGLTLLFISHNLAVVRFMADVVGVMYLGRLVETADVETLFSAPRHPYTKMLLDAVPDLAMTGRKRQPVQGEIPNPINPPSGCTFHPRCPLAQDVCKEKTPVLKNGVACHLADEPVASSKA